MHVLHYSPGQKVSIILETLNNDGYREDGIELPQITRIVFPDLSLADDYPQDMVKLDTGLYYYQFTLPAGGAAVGSYLVDIMHQFANDITKNYLYQVLVNAQFGNFTVSPS